MGAAPDDPGIPNPLGDFLGNLFDTFTAPFRGIADALNFSIGEPLTGNTFQAGNPVTEDQMGKLIEGGRAAGLSDEQLDSLFRLSDIGATPAAIQDRIFQLEKENKTQEFLKPFEDQREHALQVARTNIAEQKGRFENILNTPGAIRADEDFGTALATAENRINAQTNANERAQAGATAQSGLRASGNAAQQVLLGRERAATSKAGVEGKLRSEARNRLSDLQRAEIDVEKGFLPDFLQGAAFNASSLSSPDPLNNILGVSLGVEEGQRGSAQQSLGTLIGTAQTATDQVNNTLDTILGNVFNG